MKLFIAFLILLFSNFNFSHEMNPARLVLSEDANSNYKVTWMFPSKGIGLPAEVSFPDCTESGKSLPSQESKYLITNLNLDCGESIKGKSITFKGLSRVTDALILHFHPLEPLINPDLSFPNSPLSELACHALWRA